MSIPMITESEETLGQYATKAKALRMAKQETNHFLSRPKHIVSLCRTWRNLEERMCWYVHLDCTKRKF